MATTQSTYTGNNSTTDYSFTFPYVKEADVKVSLDTVVKTQDTDYTFANATTISFDTAPGTGVAIRIFRETDTENAVTTFFAGSAIRAQDLNDNTNQVLYSAQERVNRDLDKTGDTMTGDLTMNNANVVFEGATADDFETTLTVTDPTADRTITLPNVTGTVITTGDTNTVTGTMIAADAINGDRIADDSINSEHYADGSIDTAHIADSQITTAKLADSNVTTAKLAADAVNGSKIADDSINSEHYVDGSIDTAHIADSQITTAKLADANVTTAKIADDAVTAAKLATGSVGPDALAATSVSAGSYTAADITVDADGRITAASSGSIATSEIADSAVTTAKLADANVTHAKLANDAVDGDNIANDSINSEHYVDGSIDTAHIADQQVTSGKLATNAVTTGKINADAITNAKIADDAVQAENINGLTASITELNQLDGNTLSNSSVDWTSGTTFPSASQISARLALFGGFEAIDDDESFPNTAPAEGVIISIANAGGLTVNSSGTSTNGDTLNDTTVTINEFPSGFNSTTLDDGIGLLVVATSTAHTYNFHRVVAKDEDVRQLSSDINDFKARYRTGSSNPTTNNDAGDLFFNTDTDKMLVRNGDNNAWEEVQSVGEFFIIPSTDFPTWNGSLNDISITNNAPANAEQILLSINGVIQEPNSGTSRPSDGFALDGSTIRLAAAPATGSTAFGVILGSTVNIGTPSNNTVSEAKLNCSNDPTNGHVLTARSGNTGGLTWEAAPTTDLDAAVTINESGNSVDFRVESNDNANMFVVDGSANRVGIGTATPSSMLNLSGADPTITLSDTDGTNDIVTIEGVSGAARITARDGNADGEIIFRKFDGTTQDETMRITSAGNVGIGDSSPSARLHVTGANTASRGQLTIEGTSADARMSFYRDTDFIGHISGHSDHMNLSTESGHHIEFSPAESEAMRITTAGNVGIGTDSPSTPLHVQSTSGEVFRASATGGAQGVWSQYIGGSGNVSLIVGVDSAAGGFKGAGACGLLWNEDTGGLAFGTDDNERMRITDGGSVCINTTSGQDSAFLTVRSTANHTISSVRTGTGGENHIAFRNANGKVGSVTTSGSSTAYNTSSDYRLKENVVNLTGAIDRVKQLAPKRFNFKVDADTTVDGFLAHEAQTVVPEAVSGTKDEVDADNEPVYQGIDQSKLVPLLTAALQEAITKIETLETKVAALEGS